MMVKTKKRRAKYQSRIKQTFHSQQEQLPSHLYLLFLHLAAPSRLGTAYALVARKYLAVTVISATTSSSRFVSTDKDASKS